MTCDSEYQSNRCCEVSGPPVGPHHSLTVPQAQIGSRPKSHKVTAVAAMIAKVTQAASVLPVTVTSPA